MPSAESTECTIEVDAQMVNNENDWSDSLANSMLRKAPAGTVPTPPNSPCKFRSGHGTVLPSPKRQCVETVPTVLGERSNTADLSSTHHALPVVADSAPSSSDLVHDGAAHSAADVAAESNRVESIAATAPSDSTADDADVSPQERAELSAAPADRSNDASNDADVDAAVEGPAGEPMTDSDNRGQEKSSRSPDVADTPAESSVKQQSTTDVGADSVEEDSPADGALDSDADKPEAEVGVVDNGCTDSEEGAADGASDASPALASAASP